MKKLFILISMFVTVIIMSCSTANNAQLRYEREAKEAAYLSEYANVVNKLEKIEGNFNTYRRVVFYNVRLGETVFACEGYCHIKIDKDGDVEIVVKIGENTYLRHYLGQKEDITYFSEQLTGNYSDTDKYRYKISFNPKLWLPVVDNSF